MKWKTWIERMGSNEQQGKEDSELLETSILRWQIPISLVLMLFAGFSLGGLPYLRFEDDLESLFRGETPEYRDYKKFSRLFGTGDQDHVILLTADNVLSISNLKRIRDIDTGLHELNHLTHISSLCHLLDTKRIGRILLPVLPFKSSDEAAWLQASRKLPSHPLGRGALYSEDQRFTLLTFRFAEGVSEVEKLATLGSVERLLQDRWGNSIGESGLFDPRPGAVRSPSGSRGYGLTGLPVLQREVTCNLQRDQLKFTWLGLIFALLIGWCLFRKPIPVLFVAAVPFLGLGCIMGLLGWLGMPLNIVNNVITPLVLVIGFAEVIHILFLTGGFIGGGMHYRQAVSRMLRQLFLPCFLAALTTAIGFGSLYLSADKSLREFAIVASVSSLVMFLVVLSASGCLLATPLARFCVRLPSENRAEGNLPVPGIFRGDLTISLVILGALVSVVLLAYTAAKNHTDYRFTENLPERNVAVVTLRQIDRAFGGSSSDQLILKFASKPTPEYLIRILRLVREEVESIESVQQTTSLLNLLDALPPRGGTDREHFRELKYLPRQAWENFLQIKPTIACLHLKLPDLGSNRMVPVLNQMENKMSQIETQNQGLSTTITGLNVLAVRRSEQMIGDLTRSILGASTAIFLLIFIVYRRASFALAAIVVNAIPILGVAAVMSLVGQPIQYTGIMLLCVCLGLAVDDTVHFLSKLTFVIREGRTFEEAVLETINRLWPVFVTTSLMLGVGFGLAATSEIPTFQTFGGYACLALLLALIADLVVLPYLLIGMHRWWSQYRSSGRSFD